MSKLAHSNQETMDEIERRAREREERGERDEPIEIIAQNKFKIGQVNVTTTFGRIK